ncbi:hypothetical protein T439DRAFT_5884 [Meredithblackwellia eburnea MCA 4105]
MLLTELDSPRTLVLQDKGFLVALSLLPNEPVQPSQPPSSAASSQVPAILDAGASVTFAMSKVVGIDFMSYEKYQNGGLKTGCTDSGRKPSKVEGCLGLIELEGLSFAIMINLSVMASVNPPKGVKGFGVEPVRRILQVTFHCLDCVMETDALHPSHPCYRIKKILEDGNFYFAANAGDDITSRIDLRLARAKGEFVTAYQPLARAEQYKEFGPLVTAFKYNPTLTFNFFALTPLLGGREDFTPQDQVAFDMVGTFAIPCIHGYFRQNDIKLGGNPGVLTVISRVCPNRTGTRFIARGADHEGEVANFVETETIVRTTDQIYSHVQVRGSAPFLWKEKLDPERVNVTLAPAGDSLFPFQSHFYSLFDSYRQVHIMNLLAQPNSAHPELAGEGQLLEMYEKLVDQCTSSEEEFDKKLGYQSFDIHKFKEQPGGMDNLPSQLFKDDSLVMHEFGATSIPVNSKTGEAVTDSMNAKRQGGVVRTNCRDCLDRTNLVQSLIAYFTLAVHLFQGDHADTIQERLDIDKSLRHLFADNGDRLSVIYSGAGAENSHFTATLHSSPEDDQLNKVIRDLRRKNALFIDKNKQRGYDELTGKKLKKREAWLIECETADRYILQNGVPADEC